MDRATDSGSVGRAFESRQAYSCFLIMSVRTGANIKNKRVSWLKPQALIKLCNHAFCFLPVLLILTAGSPAVINSPKVVNIDSAPPSHSSPVVSSAGRADQPGLMSDSRFLRVIRVIDGDSLEVEGVGEVRLIGVDTPELYHPLKPVQYYAREASEFVKNLVGGSRVRLEYDQERVDKYGRTLAYVYLEDGRSLNEEIIRNGYGFALLRFPFRHLVRYRQLEAQAREKGLGLWRDQGLAEFDWILDQKTIPYEIFEMANNWWGIRYREYVRLRLTTDELGPELVKLRQWTSEFSPADLEKTLLANGWLKLNR